MNGSQAIAIVSAGALAFMARDGWFEQKLQGRATAEAYSPVEQVRASTPPTSIVQGDADTLTPLSGAERYCARLIELGGTCELHVYEGVGHLLTRNLEYQEGDFDPDPVAVADGIAEHLRFLRELGFLAASDLGAGDVEPVATQLTIATFSPMDPLFCGIAVYEGYKLSFRQLTDDRLRREGPRDVGLGSASSRNLSPPSTV